ncbi:MAG: GNAT family N-acetyltransferase [Succinivibrio sp.]
MISVRKANLSDLPVINKLAQTLVPDSFKGVLNTSQIDFMLDKFYSTEALLEAFSKGKEYFIATLDGEDTGVVSVLQQGPDLFLMQKIYVEIKNQGKGVGSELFRTVVDHVKEIHKGPCTIELIINRHNPGLNFYIRRGMEKIRDKGIDM